jgi:putative transposase
MTREARAVVVGIPHHITQRGNNRQDVFFVDDDRGQYLLTLKSKAQQYGLTIHAYCLMTNHVHIVATPLHEDALAKGIGRTHYFYTRYVNRLHGRNGHLWQNRFFSCPLDEPYFFNTIRYIERNPVRAKMVRKASRYAWSSAKVHVAGKDPSGLLSFSEWPTSFKGERWNEQLQESEDDQIMGMIRNSTSRGHPLGSDRFISKLETLVGRRLRAAPMGRPRKKAKPTKKRRRK